MNSLEKRIGKLEQTGSAAASSGVWIDYADGSFMYGGRLYPAIDAEGVLSQAAKDGVTIYRMPDNGREEV